MNLRSLLEFIVLSSILGFGLSFSVSYIKRDAFFQKKCWMSSNNNNKNLDRELDLFFEKAAEDGSSSISKLTLEERVERVIQGEQLENDIFEIRDQILELGK